ncbi:MAG: hypothetical protein Q9221_007904 [Calogaya cf. arnoldii]
MVGSKSIPPGQIPPFRFNQPVTALRDSGLDIPFPIRHSPAKRLSITCAYPPASTSQTSPRKLSNASSLSHSSTNTSISSGASKRPIDVIDLTSSLDSEDDDDDVPVTPKRLRTFASEPQPQPKPAPAFEAAPKPAPEIALPRRAPEAVLPRRESPAPLHSPLSASSPTSARFRAVEVPVKRPYAIIPRTPAAVAQRQLFEKNLSKLKGPKVTVVNEIDESSPSTDFRFVQESILQADVEYIAEEFMIGCRCYKENGRNIGCEYLYCDCLDSSELNDDGKRVFPYAAGKKDFRCLRNFYLESRNHIYECNKKCNCEANCKNRNVQHGRRVELEIFKTKNRGWGLRCPVALRKGDFVDTYRGEIITVAESNKRGLKRSPDEENYFFGLDKFCELEMIPKDEFIEKFPEDVEGYRRKIKAGEADTDMKDGEEMWENPDYVPYEYVVDGMYVGSPTRFMNHSCDPNCRLFTVSYNHADTNLYDLAFFTLEEIPAGTELTFDYKDEDDRTVITDEQARQVQKNKGYMPQKCLCGTAECRRYFFN